MLPETLREQTPYRKDLITISDFIAFNHVSGLILIGETIFKGVQWPRFIPSTYRGVVMTDNSEE